MLGAAGFPLILYAAFAGAGPRNDEYGFGWEQKAGVMLGCATLWLACIVLSNWRPRSPLYRHALGGLQARLASANAAASESAWYELSRTRTIRALGVVQGVVCIATALAVLVFTSAPWYVAVLAALVLSIVVNLGVSLSRSRVRST